MDTSFVEVLRKLDTPIIVITEDSEGECDAVAESDSDAEIVELEKNREGSVQKDDIEEKEVEDVNTNDKEDFEENTPDLEKTKQNVETEKDNEGLPKGVFDSHGRGFFIARSYVDSLVINIHSGKRTETGCRS